MRLYLSVFFGLCLCPHAALAKAALETEIRSVETESTEIFTIFETLSNAQTALDRRDYILARRGFESVLLYDPELQPARSGLRRTLIALGDVSSATKLIDDPNSADAILIKTLSGSSTTPLKDLEIGLQMHTDSRLWNLLGRLQDGKGQHAQARQAYAMAGLAGQRLGLSENNIGQSFLLSGDTEKALDAFDRAVAADPTDARFDNNRRGALVKLGRLQPALAGLNADRASVFLAQAGDRAATDDDIKLAKYLYRKSLDLSPRFNPDTARKLEMLQFQSVTVSETGHPKRRQD